MARTAKLGLSKHETKGFRISIGKKADGNSRTFWLGHQRAVAEYAAEMYRRQWNTILGMGGTCWTPEAEEHIKKQVEAIKPILLHEIPNGLARHRAVAEQELEQERIRRLQPLTRREERFERSALLLPRPPPLRHPVQAVRRPPAANQRRPPLTQTAADLPRPRPCPRHGGQERPQQ